MGKTVNKPIREQQLETITSNERSIKIAVRKSENIKEEIKIALHCQFSSSISVKSPTWGIKKIISFCS